MCWGRRNRVRSGAAGGSSTLSTQDLKRRRREEWRKGGREEWKEEGKEEGGREERRNGRCEAGEMKGKVGGREEWRKGSRKEEGAKERRRKGRWKKSKRSTTSGRRQQGK